MREMTTKNSPQDNVLDSLCDLTQLTQAVKAWGKEFGFQEIRIANAAADMSQSESGLKRWLAEGYHGEMDYMGKHGTGVLDPQNSSPAPCGSFRRA